VKESRRKRWEKEGCDYDTDCCSRSAHGLLEPVKTMSITTRYTRRCIPVPTHLELGDLKEEKMWRGDEQCTGEAALRAGTAS